MKKYLFKRILFSIASFAIVLGVVNVLIFNLMDRTNIFLNDAVYNKLSNNEKTLYEYRKYEENGYLTYTNYTSTQAYINGTEEQKESARITLLASTEVKDLNSNLFLREIIEEGSRGGYETVFLPKIKNRRGVTISSAYLLFVKDLNVFQRIGSTFANLFSFETIWDQGGEDFTDRYVKIEWDKMSNMPALVGSGTTHKYLVYFDDKFPFAPT